MRLRLGTFNLESLDDRPDEGIPIAERVAVLRPQLLRMDADVLCLQEVNGQHPPEDPAQPRRLLALDQLLEGTPYAAFERAFTVGHDGVGARDVHNLVVLSRFPIVEREQIRHDIVPPPSWRILTALPGGGAAAPVRWDRPLLRAAIDLGAGRLLHVVNLHLRAPLASPVPGQKERPYAWRSVGGWAEGYFLAEMKRAGQALEVRLLCERLLDADPGALIAVCGDFNCVERDVPFEIIRGGEDMTGSGALAMRALVPLEHTIPEDLRYSVLHAGRKAMLDHLLVTRTMLAWYRGAEIHNEALGDEVIGYANIRRSPDSYHAPVLAEFAIPPA
ncbi:MAG TPA: endonuclease/exonuclease/phosphatase family protein [Candidatus Nanopelagicales bacterium]|nr:endonuclease/exonuclease/phosphatase family protein [Candidatus Nanopelagicales bacterium]